MSNKSNHSVQNFHEFRKLRTNFVNVFLWNYKKKKKSVREGYFEKGPHVLVFYPFDRFQAGTVRLDTNIVLTCPKIYRSEKIWRHVLHDVQRATIILKTL